MVGVSEGITMPQRQTPSPTILPARPLVGITLDSHKITASSHVSNSAVSPVGEHPASCPFTGCSFTSGCIRAWSEIAWRTSGYQAQPEELRPDRSPPESNQDVVGARGTVERASLLTPAGSHRRGTSSMRTSYLCAPKNELSLCPETGTELIPRAGVSTATTTSAYARTYLLAW
jgi:hypothetical protein